MAQKALVSIVIRARDLTGRAFNKVTGRLKGLTNSLFSMKTLVAGLAAGALARGIKGLFTLGSTAEETASKFNTVFGPAVGQVTEFNNTFGEMAGLSRTAAQEITATTGAIAQGMGFAQEASAGFATDVVKLAADIGSFNNLPTEDTIVRINAALTGERESLKRLGIVILETDVQQRALLNTGKSSVEQLTQQDKATATLQLITEKAGVAVGDLARTQESFANQARRIKGLLETLGQQFGTIILEIFGAEGGFGNLAEKIKEVSGFVEENRDAIVAWGRFVIRIVNLVIAVFRDLVRVAFNVGQIIGEFANAAGRAIRAIFDPNLTMGDVMAEFVEATKGHLRDIVDAANNTAQALVDVAIAGQEAAAVTRGEGPARREESQEDKAGSTEEDDEAAAAKARAEAAAALKREVAAAATESSNLIQKLDLGLLSAEQFVAAMSELAPQMLALRDSGELADAELIKIAGAIEELRARAIELANTGEVIDAPIDALTDKVMNLGDAFKDTFGMALGAALTSSEGMAKGFSKAVATMAKSRALFFVAEGIAALAKGIFGDPRGFAAATQYFKAAALMGGVAVVASSAAGGGGGGSVVGTPEGQAQNLEAGQGSATIIIEGSLINTADPKQARALAEAIEDVSGRKVLIRGRGG